MQCQQTAASKNIFEFLAFACQRAVGIKNDTKNGHAKNNHVIGDELENM